MCKEGDKKVTEEEIVAKEAEMKKEYPESFLHPELVGGEILLQEIAVDFVHIQAGMYKQAGLNSVRIGKTSVLKPIKWHGLGGASGTSDVAHYPIFANLRQLILFSASQKAKEG